MGDADDVVDDVDVGVLEAAHRLLAGPAVDTRLGRPVPISRAMAKSRGMTRSTELVALRAARAATAGAAPLDAAPLTVGAGAARSMLDDVGLDACSLGHQPQSSL